MDSGLLTKVESGNTYGNVHQYVLCTQRPVGYAQTIISPPRLRNDQPNPTLCLGDNRVPEHPVESFGDAGLIRSVANLHGLLFSTTQFSWEYDNRRQAQMILPFLYLGPSPVARNAEFIQKNEITFLIAVRNATAAKLQPAFLNPEKFASAAGLQIMTVDLDSPFDLIRNLRRTITTMNEHLRQRCTSWPLRSLDDIKGKILMFCESGNERSPVVAAAYLMVVFGLNPVTAFQIVTAARFCVHTSPEMMLMLADFGATLQAERDVIDARGWDKRRAMGTTPARKRNSDDMFASDEETEYLEDSMVDTDAKNGRFGIAPFADA